VLFQFIVSSNVYAGDFYQMRVRAKNVWGWGQFSTILTIKAATRPAKMATKPVTSVDPVTGGVLIEWTAPFSNSQSISQYKI